MALVPSFTPVTACVPTSNITVNSTTNTSGGLNHNLPAAGKSLANSVISPSNVDCLGSTTTSHLQSIQGPATLDTTDAAYISTTIASVPSSITNVEAMVSNSSGAICYSQTANLGTTCEPAENTDLSHSFSANGESSSIAISDTNSCMTPAFTASESMALSCLVHRPY